MCVCECECACECACVCIFHFNERLIKPRAEGTGRGVKTG